MKKTKLAVKISLVIVVIFIINMVILTLLVSSRASSSMEEAAKSRLSEASMARTAVINTYMESVMSYARGYSTAPVIVDFAKDTSDEKARKAAKDFTDRYAESFDGVENIFVADFDFIVQVASITESMGSPAVNDDAQKASTQVGIDAMKATHEPYFRSIKVSPTTGTQVIVLYSPIFDENDKMVAYVTLALNADDLITVLSGLQFQDWKQAKVEIMDMNQNTYMYSTEEGVAGTELPEDAMVLVEQVKGSSESVSGVAEYVSGNDTFFSSYRTIPEYGMLVVISDSRAEILESTNALTMGIILLSVIMVVIIAVLTALFVNILVRDLSKSGRIITDIASTLDFTKVKELEKYTKRGDEVGEVSRATKQLTDAVIEAVNLIQDKSIKVSHSAEDLNRSAEDTKENSVNITTAVNEIATGATSQAETIQDGVQAVSAILESVDSLDSEVSAVSTQTDAMKNSSNNMKTSFEDLSSAMEETKDALVSVSGSMETVSEFVDEVKGAANAINDIASQTNLLSLNASIEAARAGEAGRGFAVVAEEIGGLADESAKSSNSIGEIMTRLQEKTNEAVETVKSLENVIERQKNIANETEGTVSEVVEMIDAVEQAFRGIKSACELIKERCAVVNDTMSGLSAISEENAASSEETSATMEQVNTAVYDINSLAGDLSGIASDLDRELSRFKTRE